MLAGTKTGTRIEYGRWVQQRGEPLHLDFDEGSIDGTDMQEIEDRLLELAPALVSE